MIILSDMLNSPIHITNVSLLLTASVYKAYKHLNVLYGDSSNVFNVLMFNLDSIGVTVVFHTGTAFLIRDGIFS